MAWLMLLHISNLRRPPASRLFQRCQAEGPNDQRFPVNRISAVGVESYVSRLDKFEHWCDGKTVLHLGCSSGRYIDDRLARGTFLHEVLLRRAKHLSGLDLDRDSLLKMQELGYSSLYHGNAEQLDEAGIRRTFEVIVAGDILEHITRPGDLLETAKPLLARNGQFIVSTNNAFGLGFQVKRWLGRYVEHFEHVCFYSPETLVHLFERHGYTVVGLYGAFTVPPNGRLATLIATIARPLLKLFPVLAGTLILVAEVSGETAYPIGRGALNPDELETGLSRSGTGSPKANAEW